MCKENIKDDRITNNLLGIDRSIDNAAKSSAVKWFGHLLNRKHDDILKKASSLKYTVDRYKKDGDQKTHIMKEEKEIGLTKDIGNRPK